MALDGVVGPVASAAGTASVLAGGLADTDFGQPVPIP
jgi:hypothetical protein